MANLLQCVRTRGGAEEQLCCVLASRFVNHRGIRLSKLFKNVPFVTSFKMSPFCFLTLYFFPSGFPRKISCQRAPGTRIAISLDLSHPLRVKQAL
jgi:hypothetical protein